MSTKHYSEADSKAQIQAWKEALDIITVAEKYGELVKTGANYKYKDDSSIVINPTKQIFNNFSDSAKGAVGSVLDLIMYMEKCDLAAGVKILKELNGVDEYIVSEETKLKRKKQSTKKKDVNFQQLGLFAKNDLEAGLKFKPFELDMDGTTSLSVNPSFHKLFERTTFPLDFKRKLEYIHNNIIGYDNYYKCASIILRDCTGKVVDKQAYRPSKPASYKNWVDPKYIPKNTNNRGDNFLYPFQEEIEKIIKREKYFIVGEGIKNAVNALLYSAPFISLESSASATPVKLIEYIKDLKDKGYGLVCLFDGDTAGLKAYEKFKTTTGLECENHLDFKSNIDFTDHMVKGEK